MHTVFVNDHIIPESDKLVLQRGTLHIRQLKWLFQEKYPTYCASVSGPPKPLAHFLSYQAKEKIIQNMKTRDPTYEGRVSDLMYAPNDVIEDLLAKCVIPKSFPDYCAIFLKEVDSLENVRFEFKVRGYHRYLHEKVDKMIDQIELYDNLVRRNANVQESQAMPKLKWGRNTNPQAFNIFLHCFRPFKENFYTLLTEEFLKACEDTAEFCRTLRLKNNRMSQNSLRYEIQEASVQPHEKLDDMDERFKKEEMVRKLKDGAATPRSDFMKSKARVNHIEPEEISGDGAQSFLNKQDEYEDEYIALNAFQRVPPAHPVDGASQQRVYPQQHTSRPPQKDHGPSAKPTPRLCMDKLLTGKCSKEATCTYSHNEAACREFVSQRAKMYTSSPYYSSPSRVNMLTDMKALEEDLSADEDST